MINTNPKEMSLQKSKAVFKMIFFFATIIIWTYRNCVRLIRFPAEQWTEKKTLSQGSRHKICWWCFFNPSSYFYLDLIWSSATNFSFCRNYFSTLLWSCMIKGVSRELEAKFTQPKRGKCWKYFCNSISLSYSCQHCPWEKHILSCPVCSLLLLKG